MIRDVLFGLERIILSKKKIVLLSFADLIAKNNFVATEENDKRLAPSLVVDQVGEK